MTISFSIYLKPGPMQLTQAQNFYGAKGNFELLILLSLPCTSIFFFYCFSVNWEKKWNLIPDVIVEQLARAREMTQWLAACTAFAEDLSLLPNTPMRWVTSTCNCNSWYNASGLHRNLYLHTASLPYVWIENNN